MIVTHNAIANGQELQKIGEYVWVNSRSMILTRKNDEWKYIKKNIFFNAEYLVMVHLTL